MNWKGGASAVHQPLLLSAAWGRNELTRRPTVGTSHATVSPITATCSATRERRAPSHSGEKRAASTAAGSATCSLAIVIGVTPPGASAAG